MATSTSETYHGRCIQPRQELKAAVIHLSVA
jgi:hypothetical protein